MEDLKKDTLIEDLSLQSKTKEILISAGYKTIGDLAAAKKEDVEKHFIGIKENSISGYNGSEAFKHLKTLLHHVFNITFAGEYEHLGLTLEVATIPTTSLELPTVVKNILINQFMAYTLGDILTIDYQDFVKARNFGQHYLKVLKDFIHKLGYTLKDEEPTLNEILISLKEKGVKLLEETIDNADIYTRLYKNGIYTLDDLLNYGPDVTNIAGFGPKRQNELAKIMQELNLSFKANTLKTIDIPSPTVDIKLTNTIIEQAEKENNAVQSRINQKEILIAKYEGLMLEREKLIAKEKELDQLIETTINSMKEDKSYGRK